MPSKRALAAGGVRILTGIVGLGVAVAAIAGATLVPLHSVRITPPRSTVTPIPADQERVCPGPLLELGAGSDPNGLSTAGSPSVVATASGTVAERTLAMQGVTGGGPGPTVITTPAAGSAERPLIAGAQSQQPATADLVGLAAAACGEASSDSWLVAGATTLGDTSLVMLSNPTSVQATVDLTVYTESGQVSAPGVRGLIVRANSEMVVPLAGIAPGVQAPVVRVQASGGSIYATMQESAVSGLAPQGVELVGPTAAPATRQVIAGMVVANQTGAQPTVRVVAPGAATAKVTVTAVNEQQPSIVVSSSITLQGGVVREIPLSNVIDGGYTVTVTSDQPVVAAARTIDAASQTTGGTATAQAEAATQDFAWFVASAPLTGDEMVVIPQGPSPVLHLANAAGTTAVVAVSGPGGTTVTVPAGQAVSLPVSPGGQYTLSGATDVRASVSLTADGSSSAFALEPPGPLAQPITVYAK
jgi:hypothetical protein